MTFVMCDHDKGHLTEGKIPIIMDLWSHCDLHYPQPPLLEINALFAFWQQIFKSASTNEYPTFDEHHLF